LPDLINQDSDGNTYYNYQTPLEKGLVSAPRRASSSPSLDAWLTAAFGANSAIWTKTIAFNIQGYAIRFPVAFETLAGNPSINVGNNTIGSGTRFGTQLEPNFSYINASTDASVEQIGSSGSFGFSTPIVGFGVVNAYSFVYATFSDLALTTPAYFIYGGWLKNPAYGGTNYPINCTSVNIGISLSDSFHPQAANNTTKQQYLTSGLANPTIDCGGDSCQVVMRNNTGNNIYVGDLYNVIQVPNTFNYGVVYKNIGASVSPGGNDFWMPCAPYGSRRLAIRIYTEGFV
jgi:hypothetical protein